MGQRIENQMVHVRTSTLWCADHFVLKDTEEWQQFQDSNDPAANGYTFVGIYEAPVEEDVHPEPI